MGFGAFFLSVEELAWGCVFSRCCTLKGFVCGIVIWVAGRGLMSWDLL